MNGHDPVGKEFDWLGRRVTISTDLVHQELDGEIVVLNMRSGQYFGIDPMGSRIWRMLEENVPLQGIMERLMAEYDVEAEVCRRQVASFLDALESNGLVSFQKASTEA